MGRVLSTIIIFLNVPETFSWFPDGVGVGILGCLTEFAGPEDFVSPETECNRVSLSLC